MARADSGTLYSRAYRAASIIGAVLLGLVAGCATPSTAISEKTDLNINQGVVTLRVVNLHERSLKYVKIQNIETLEEVILVPQATLGGGSYRFTGIVAAGRYKPKRSMGQTLTTSVLCGFTTHSSCRWIKTPTGSMLLAGS